MEARLYGMEDYLVWKNTWYGRLPVKAGGVVISYYVHVKLFIIGRGIDKES